MMWKKLGLFVPLTVALLTVSLAGAQQTAKIPRLCYLAPYPIAELPPVTAAGLTAYDAFLRGLRDLGYVEGQSITIDYLSADGQFARFPTLASDCLRLQADMIVAGTTPAAPGPRSAPPRRSRLSYSASAIPSGRGSWPASPAPAATSRASPTWPRG